MNPKGIASNIVWFTIWIFLLTLISARVTPCSANDDTDEQWQEFLQELLNRQDDENEDIENNPIYKYETAYAYLQALSDNPLNINTAETEDLISIPGVTLLIANDILEHRHKYGNIKSLDELVLISSIDNRLRSFLKNFFTVKDTAQKEWWRKENMRNLIKRSTHTITTTATIPTYYHAGDRAMSGVKGNKYAGKYIGDPVKHSVRYKMSIDRHIVLNITGAKQAAEPFGHSGNALGYDSYAINLTLNKIGIFRKIIVGHYRGTFGMGLVLNNNFSIGKQLAINSAGKQTSVFSPHNSGSDYNHFQGLAAVGDYKGFQFAIAASYRPIDATLNRDSTISTILTSGLHQTALEMGKKNNSHLLTTAFHSHYRRILSPNIKCSMGLSFVYTRSNRKLNPTFTVADTISRSKLYRLYYPHGQNFWNLSTDYSLRSRTFAFQGETAINDAGAIATVNSISWQPSHSINLNAIQHYYSERYYSIYGASIGRSSNVTNENGLYLSAQWYPMRRLTIDAYSDLTYFPWLRYRVPAPSYLWENGIMTSYSRSRWSLSLRYRLRSQQRNYSPAGHNILYWEQKHSLRLTFLYELSNISLSSQAELVGISLKSNSTGYMISQSATYKPQKRWNVWTTISFFNTDDYATRLYLYEHSPLYTFGYSSYYGRGIRVALSAKLQLSERFSAICKAGHTRYFDRKYIGTAERIIYSNHRTDIDVQLRLRLFR